jgi:hypothetical protein
MESDAFTSVQMDKEQINDQNFILFWVFLHLNF